MDSTIVRDCPLRATLFKEPTKVGKERQRNAAKNEEDQEKERREGVP